VSAMLNNFTKRARARLILKWIIFGALIILADVILTTGRGNIVKPIFLIPIVISISVSENELVAGVLGAICGILLDISLGKLVGSNAIFMLITGVLTSLIFLHLMRKNIFNVIFLSAIATILHGLLDLFFYYAMWNYKNYSIVFIHKTIPSMFYTIISAPFIYIIIKFITKKLTPLEVLSIEEAKS